MTQYIYSGSSLFKESWENVTTAYWSKNNSPFSRHIVTEDVVERAVVDGKLHTTRFLLKKQSVPGWVMRLISPDNKTVKVLERSVVDPVNRTCVVSQENLNCCRVLKVCEVLRITQPVCSRETSLQRDTIFTSTISRIIAKQGFSRYTSNIINTDKSINCTLGLLEECGTNFLPSIARNLSMYKAAKSLEFKEFKAAKSLKFKEFKDNVKRVRTESQSKEAV